MLSSVEKKSFVGMSYNSIFQLAKQAIEFFVGIALARLLVPEDFGLMSTAMIFFGIANIFTNFGISTAIVQRENISKKYIGCCQSLASILCLSIFMIVFLGSPLLAIFYNNDEIGVVIRFLSIVFLFTSFNIVPNALLVRKLQIVKASLANVIGSLMYSIVSIVLAFNGFGVWSLVYGAIASSFVMTIAMMLFSSYKPQFSFDMPLIKEITGFSSGVGSSTLLNYGARNVDYLFVGKNIGQYDLGIYSRAYSLATLPKEVIALGLGPLLLPSYSRLTCDRERFESYFYDTLHLILLFSLPMCLGLYLLAPHLIFIVYGEKWSMCIAPLKILSVSVVFYCLYVPFNNCLLAFGKIKANFIIQLFYAGILSASVLGCSYYGIVPVSIAVSITIFLTFCLSVFVANKTFKISLKKMAYRWFPLLFSSSLMSAFIAVIQVQLKIESVFSLLIVVFTSIVIYALGCFFFRDNLFCKVIGNRSLLGESK